MKAVKPGLEHAAEVWWTGGQAGSRKPKTAQLRLRRILLRASSTVTGVAVRGELEWRREGKKVLYGERLEAMEDS